ncbi:hypothetical protein HYFRA_00008945 [Hymenoscyphus fraxineus]|uniref:Uncharacterized protein n=1 Tax=Hymenoscyphus fraxineus TaxID=746836 RepID=A0A9N9PMT1_9HELO|nr:hypothetical protein HYFRA_00008945 [Hymenoscyphus fraxineus]
MRWNSPPFQYHRRQRQYPAFDRRLRMTPAVKLSVNENPPQGQYGGTDPPTGTVLVKNTVLRKELDEVTNWSKSSDGDFSKKACAAGLPYSVNLTPGIYSLVKWKSVKPTCFHFEAAPSYCDLIDKSNKLSVEEKVLAKNAIKAFAKIKNNREKTDFCAYDEDEQGNPVYRVKEVFPFQSAPQDELELMVVFKYAQWLDVQFEHLKDVPRWLLSHADTQSDVLAPYGAPRGGAVSYNPRRISRELVLNRRRSNNWIRRPININERE